MERTEQKNVFRLLGLLTFLLQKYLLELIVFNIDILCSLVKNLLVLLPLKYLGLFANTHALI